MKIVTPKQMAFLESQSYRNGCREGDFMENAGKKIAAKTKEFIEEKDLKRHLKPQVILLCGKGNNAGDAYVAGCYLLDQGFSVMAYQAVPFQNCSTLCQKNGKRFSEKGGLLHELQNIEDELQFPECGVILDGLFGTGFRGKVEEPFAAIIRKANSSLLPIIAIDIPSGLQGESGYVEDVAIQAEATCFLGLPKVGFFFEEGWNHTGKLHHVDFGLPQAYIDELDAEICLLDFKFVQPLLPKIVRNRHKYQAGYVVGLGGSENLSGAPLLSSFGVLRAGAGIVKLLYPENMKQELSSAPLEIIKVPYADQESAKILELMNAAKANFIGPGLGLKVQTKQLLQTILPLLEKPCVIDADALTLIAEGDIPFSKHAILTPHAGEMNRLLKSGKAKPATKDLLKQCQAYVEEHRVTLILKGGPSFIFHPGEIPCISPYGDPGMATAGSGDVLTGILAALLAQGLSLRHAAMLGLYLHGVAGEEAVKNKTSYSMIASDIIDFLPKAFKTLQKSAWP